MTTAASSCFSGRLTSGTTRWIATVIQFWYDPTKAVIKKGLGQYRQFTADASLKVGFADMGVPPYLRDALPTGATPALTQATKFLLRDWGETTLEHLNEHVVPKTTGPTVLTATWETASGDHYRRFRQDRLVERP